MTKIYDRSRFDEIDADLLKLHNKFVEWKDVQTSGEAIARLGEEYDFDCPREYYGYIVDSYANGHTDQVIELFNRMKGDLQKSYLLNVERMHPVYGEKIHDLIIKNL